MLLLVKKLVRWKVVVVVRWRMVMVMVMMVVVVRFLALCLMRMGLCVVLERLLLCCVLYKHPPLFLLTRLLLRHTSACV